MRRLNETLEQRIEERTMQVRTNEAQLRAILETTNQYHGLLDLNGTLVFANAVAISGMVPNPGKPSDFHFGTPPGSRRRLACVRTS